MAQQIPVDRDALAEAKRKDGAREIAPDVAYQRLAIVNVVYYGTPGAGDRHWVLIDAGVMGTAAAIVGAAESRFGAEAAPAAIVLTHGHFDHVGALEELAERWRVPVYAHELELPYLNGQSAYPPPDPSVGGGMMASLAGFYPRGPVNVSRWLKALPADGSVPEMPGWQWIHTPGHTVGHVSLWRASDAALIAGDAFITTAQESAYAVAVQRPEMHGPPMYYTQDWQQAEASVQRLATLQPELAVTGHGPPLHGSELRRSLSALADEFRRVAVPHQGRYVGNPAADVTRNAYRPADDSSP